ncbi:MAG: hypothetical protein ACOCP4_04515, partial [Candidatus Woesearchaeota archaeon]
MKQFKPMLLPNDIPSYDDVVFPVIASRKLDGCFMGQTRVLTENGYIKIRDIVDKRLNINVLSFNIKENKYEYKPVINWFNNGKASKKDFLKLIVDNQIVYCTKNHRILTGKGYISAENITNEKVYKRILSNKQKSIIIGSLLGDGTLSIEKRNNNFGFRLVISNKEKEYVEHKLNTLNIPYTISERNSGYGTKMYVGTTIILNDFGINLKDFYTKKYIKYNILKN